MHHIALRVVHRKVLHREVHRARSRVCKMATREMMQKVVHPVLRVVHRLKCEMVGPKLS